MLRLFVFLSVAVFFTFANTDVLELTAQNFGATIAAHQTIMVEFYAPWCGHCKSLAPIYEQAATALKEHGIVLAKVDATAHESLATQYNIKGFPTLKLFKGGVHIQDYAGPRDADGIIAYMIKKNGNPYVTVSSVAEVEAFLAKEDQGVVVGYFSDLESDDFLDFKQVADTEMNVPFLLLNDADAAKDCMPTVIGEEGHIAVFAKDGSKHVFEGSDIEGELSKFVSQHAFPQSMDLNPELFSSLLENSIIIVTAYDFDAENAADIRALASRAVAQHPSLKQMFADTTKWAQPLVRMGVVSGNVWPTFVAFRRHEQSPISWDEDAVVTEESFTAWLGEVVAGTAQTWKKSEAIPSVNDGPVKIVVAKTFAELVSENNGKNVFLEIYAPWCGHCKNLEPIYNAVGEHFAKDENVVIAKMDATANYLDPSLEVRGFPALKFFPANSDEVLSYEGDRTMEDIIEFITSHRKK